MKVSIGIPFFNPGVFFEDAIKSVLQQTFTEWELILVDDGSTDGSLTLAESVAARDRRVRVVSDGLNKGLPARLNQIIDEARYECVARMDADDLIAPDKIEKQVALLKQHVDVDVITTGLCSMDDDGTPLGFRAPRANSESDISFESLLNGRSVLVHASMLARKSWCMRNRYNEQACFMEDYQLWLEACLKQDLRIKFLPEYLYYYRESSSITPAKCVRAYRNQMHLVKSQYAQGLSRVALLNFLIRTYLKIGVVNVMHFIRRPTIIFYFRNQKIKSKACWELFDKAAQDIASIKASEWITE